MPIEDSFLDFVSLEKASTVSMGAAFPNKCLILSCLDS